jgi:hypothetical protein
MPGKSMLNERPDERRPREDDLQSRDVSPGLRNNAGIQDSRRSSSSESENGVCRDPDLIGAERLPRRGDDDLSD